MASRLPLLNRVPAGPLLSVAAPLLAGCVVAGMALVMGASADMWAEAVAGLLLVAVLTAFLVSRILAPLGAEHAGAGAAAQMPGVIGIVLRREAGMRSEATALRDRVAQLEGALAKASDVSNEERRIRDVMQQQLDREEVAISTIGRKMHKHAGAIAGILQSADQEIAEVRGAVNLAAKGIGEVAGSSEQLSKSIGQIAVQVARSADAAQQAAAESKRTDISVEELANAAGRIGDVVRLIGDIAAQTNLLALNATIEAARAGDAGRGFAVVASEVKTLAAQTARATDEIGDQIAAMQSATEGSIFAIRAISSRIDDISTLAAQVASAVEEQGAATAEIASNVLTVAQCTRAVADAFGRVEHASEAARQETATLQDTLTGAQTLREQHLRLLSEAQKSHQAA